MPEYNDELPQRRYLSIENPLRISYYLLICLIGTPSYYEQILFRNYLSENTKIAFKYQNLKKSLANRFKHDRISYSYCKGDFIKGVIEKAKEYYGIDY